MKLITMVVYQRPEFLSEVLDSLSKAEGIEDYRLMICQEPGNKEIFDLVTNIKFCEVDHIYNPHKLGMRMNTYQALKKGFQRSDYVIHLEEDVKVAPDTLRYFEWCRDEYRDDQDILTVTGYAGPHLDHEFGWKPHGSEYAEDEMYQVQRVPWFTPSGWATWGDRWKEINAKWHFGYCNVTWGMYLNLIIRGDRKQIHPTLARTQNIGYYGENLGKGKQLDEAWFYEHVHNEHWAGSMELPEGEWHE